MIYLIDPLLKKSSGKVSDIVVNPFRVFAITNTSFEFNSVITGSIPLLIFLIAVSLSLY